MNCAPTASNPVGAQFIAPVPEGLLVVTVALGAVLAPLNSTMIAVALPGIAEDLASGAAATSWLVTAYLIAMASLQPVAGRLGDRLGRRRLILGGLIGFGIASLGATLATSLPLLIACRVAQAVSGAVVLPNGDALLREIVPDERRASRFGMIGSAIGLAAAIGPPLGGILVSTAGWRAMFAVNLLLVVPALLLGWRTIPGKPHPQPLPVAMERGLGGEVIPFDWPGAVMLSTLLVALALLLSRGALVLAGPALALAVAILVVLLVLFLRRELRHPEPVLQPRFFSRPAFAFATGAVGLSNLAMYTVLLAIPILWARAGRLAAEIGMLLGIMAAAMFVASPVGGRLADRFGRRWSTSGGLTLLTLGTVQIALVGADGTLGIVLGLAALGGGLGLATPGLQASALEAVERRDAGAAAGAYSTSRYLGSIVGSAVLAGLTSAAPAGDSVSLIFVVVVAAAGLSALLAFGLPHRPRPAAST
ncbi:MAG TPA: MFS transporter [Chloroflexota bacterium]|nr:MFS transporter [Chloroflexota bacterium]